MFSTRLRNKTNAGNAILGRDQLRELAPSIFATSPFRTMTERYKMVPTIEVIDMLGDKGFRPVLAMQGGSRIEGKADFTKHLVRFRHDDHLGAGLAVGEEFPELVLTNSHDGTSAYRFEAGIFRLACLNGMIQQRQDGGLISLRHAGGPDFHARVIDVTYEVLSEAPQTLATIQEWKQIATTPAQREIFAEAAAELRDNDTYKPARLLDTRRWADREHGGGIKPDVWTVGNVIQENVIRGGVAGYNPETFRRTRTREVKSVGENVRLNKALWTLTERFAQLAGG